MNTIKRNILFFLDIEKGKPDAKIRMRIRYAQGQLVNFNVGYRADVEKWIKEVQRCKSGTSHGKKKIPASEINTEIQRLESLAENIFKRFELINHLPSPDEFRDEFNQANDFANGIKPTSEKSFFDVFNEFISTVSVQNNWSKSTIQKFMNIRRMLYSYNSKLSFDSLQINDLHGFVTYLHGVPVTMPKKSWSNPKVPEYQNGLRNTTIAKTVNFVKWFLRWAFSNGYYDGNLHTIWKPKLKASNGDSKEIIHLTWNELIKLYDFEFPENKQHLSRTRDVFCFQCFTSLRYSDVAKLSKSDVKDGYISIVTQKTSDALKIELNKYSSAILEKYKDIPLPKDKALPVISNPKMNEFLKEMGEIVGFDEPQRIVYFLGGERKEEVFPKWKLLSTHDGRRTFIVNALHMGIPLAVIMRWTGHADYKAMKPYIKIVDELKEQEMNKFNLK